MRHRSKRAEPPLYVFSPDHSPREHAGVVQSYVPCVTIVGAPHMAWEAVGGVRRLIVQPPSVYCIFDL